MSELMVFNFTLSSQYCSPEIHTWTFQPVFWAGHPLTEVNENA